MLVALQDVKGRVNADGEVLNGQVKTEFKKELQDGKNDDSPLNWLADVALSSSHDDKKDVSLNFTLSLPFQLSPQTCSKIWISLDFIIQ